jgi:hypothetical protein
MNGDPNQYEAAIKALGCGTGMPPQMAARIERNLLRAFAARHAVLSHGSRGSTPARSLARRLRASLGPQALPSPTRPGGNRRWRPWLAAAVLLVAAIGIQVRRDARTVTEDHVTSTSSTPAPTLVPAAPTRAVPKQGSVLDATSGATSRPVVRTKRAAARVVRPSGFVALPGSAGLPPFESGTIVRMELQLASLPAYGIDISPAADDRPVEADVLVGQDGQPRAMRLITNSPRSVQ